MDMGDLAETLHMKKSSMYQKIYHGKLDIPHIKNGKKYLFVTEDTAAYLISKIQ